MYIAIAGKASRQPSWQQKVGQFKEDVSPCMRRILDYNAKNVRRSKAIKALMEKGQRLCQSQGAEMEMLLIVRYTNARKGCYVYTGQGEMLERFRQGKVIQPNLSLLKPHSTLQSQDPALPAVEVDTPSKSVMRPESEAYLAQERHTRRRSLRTVLDTTTAKSSMLCMNSF